MYIRILRHYFLKQQRFISARSKYLSTYNPATIKICVVGAGPAGFYAAQYLLKHLTNCQVDVIEKLPVPFGLVRFGVAPDHPEVKNVINTFTKTAENPRFNFYGNVTLGEDIGLQELRDRYHTVLLTYGASKDRQLNIPNENQMNCISARDFVAWYNGLPEAKDLKPNLNGQTVAIIGQGNVAIDVARMLLKSTQDLKKTDITSYAWEALNQSKVEKVYMIGRRGPLQVAFTIKELREMLKLQDVITLWRPEDFHGISHAALEQLPRPRKRLTELMLKSLQEQKLSKIDITTKHRKQFLPIFLRSPKFIESNEITFTVNRMDATNIDRAVATNLEDTMACDLILRSIGYKASCADNGICFDPNNGRVFNQQGRVFKSSKNLQQYDENSNSNHDYNRDDIDKGLYVAGWLATGPTGVILTTMNNAFFVAQLICDDITNKIIDTETRKPGLTDYFKTHPYVNWKKWCRIDAEELKRGKNLGKSREKVVDINEMLHIAGV